MLDIDAAQRNIDRMASELRRLGPTTIRPHYKTHKSPDLARRQVQAGASGLSMATVWEAAVLAADGFDDLFVVNTVAHPDKIRLLAELARDHRILVAIAADPGLFGGVPGEVGSGAVSDPANRTQIQIDVAVLAPAEHGRPRKILSLGEVKWDRVMDLRHVERLRRAQDLLAVKGFDTRDTLLTCYSGAGFDRELQAGQRPGIRLVGLASSTRMTPDSEAMDTRTMGARWPGRLDDQIPGVEGRPQDVDHDRRHQPVQASPGAREQGGDGRRIRGIGERARHGTAQHGERARRRVTTAVRAKNLLIPNGRGPCGRSAQRRPGSTATSNGWCWRDSWGT